MNFDEHNLIVQDPPSNDGGDTCNRMGHYFTLQFVWRKLGLPTPTSLQVLWKNGSIDHTYKMLTDSRSHLFMRHPTQVHPIGANNPLNCTRDQINPMIVALGLHWRTNHVWRQLWNLVKRLGFYQNFERDYPGTTKGLLPQWYTIGQRYDSNTIIQRDQCIWKPDYADLASLNDWGVYLRATRGLFFWPLLVVTDIFMVLASLAHCFIYAKDPSNTDDMQILQQFIQAKLIMPTPFSWLARKAYFQFRPRNDGNMLYPAAELAPEGAVYHYFCRGYDSKDWITLWIPVIAWLRGQRVERADAGRIFISKP